MMAGISPWGRVVVLLALVLTSTIHGAQADASAPDPARPIANSLLPAALGADGAPHGTADPFITRSGGRYYATYTSWNRIEVRSAPSLALLSVATPKVVWPTKGVERDPADCCLLWAPELHRLKGPHGTRWYLYYASEPAGQFAASGHRIRVLESTSDSPMGPYRSSTVLDTKTSSMTIDPTVYQAPDGSTIMFFSASPDHTVATEVLMAIRLKNPWTTQGDPIVVTRPTLPWEMVGTPLVEAPEVLVRRDRFNLVYSAGMYLLPTGYSLGVLSVPRTADLMDPTTWLLAKRPVPLLTSAPDRGVFSPGHCSFFSSPDGKQTWIAYHAYSQPLDGLGQAYEAYSGSGGPTPPEYRTTRVQPISFNSDDTIATITPVTTANRLRAPGGDRSVALQLEDLPSSAAEAGRLVRVDQQVTLVGDAGATLSGVDTSRLGARIPVPARGTYRVYLRYVPSSRHQRLVLRVGDARATTDPYAKVADPRVLIVPKVKLPAGTARIRIAATGSITLDELVLRRLR